MIDAGVRGFIEAHFYSSKMIPQKSVMLNISSNGMVMIERKAYEVYD